ncbi:M28 family peptidase [Chitinophaga horti]|uniref:M28 family peptidase n=1 Tax=Chitinophaga horti TaxID=2920382 RepID=A0ABY6IZX0_9BACT|nr:M28 family peptidase [Chitinophaga horti]UYQ92937.1 M28 family peptidase [Chitinophaga horti]
MQKLKWITGMALLLAACQTKPKPAENNNETATTTINTAGVPAFSADSAYSYVAKQVAFGPRVPGTKAQKECAAWLIQTLRPLSDTLYVQETTVTGPQKQKLPCINLVASFNPGAKDRVLILAHWDTRPWGDQDAFDKKTAIDGADDGGSGVGVMIELARQFQQKKPAVGIDLLFTDVEDYGVSGVEDSYCLGTQYWAKNPHVKGYKANYGILLDMVGARGSQFFMEGFSKRDAYGPMKMFWDVANQLGYSQFRYENAQDVAITDDHYYVNTLTGIPTYDIIALQQNGDFAPHWHTANDNMQIIDKSTLKAVGQSLLQVLYTQPLAY